MRLGQAFGQRDADRASWKCGWHPAQRLKRATVTEYDTLDRRVVAQHRDQNIAAAGIGDTARDCAPSRAKASALPRVRL